MGAPTFSPAGAAYFGTVEGLLRVPTDLAKMLTRPDTPSFNTRGAATPEHAVHALIKSSSMFSLGEEHADAQEDCIKTANVRFPSVRLACRRAPPRTRSRDALGLFEAPQSLCGISAPEQLHILTRTYH